MLFFNSNTMYHYIQYELYLFYHQLQLSLNQRTWDWVRHHLIVWD